MVARFYFIVFILSAWLSTQLLADDWPCWMGPALDGEIHESGLVKDKLGSADEIVVWRQPIGGGYAGPAVVGDQLFVMDRTDDEKGGKVENNIRAAGELAGGERVQCIDIATGKTLWEHKYDCVYRIAYPTGPRTTPTVDGDHVFTLGAMGRLICFEKANGKLVWEKELTEEYKTKPPLWGYSSHPLIYGDYVIVPVGGDGSGVVAFDRLTGKEVWKAVDTFDVAYAPLVMFSDESGKERQLIFWHAEGVVSLNPADGKAYWDIKFPKERNPSQTSIATPKILGNQILIVEYYKGSMLLEIGSNPPSVKELWRSNEDDPRSEESLNCMMATPAVKDGHAYGICYNGRGQGVVRCIEIEGNELKWEQEDWLSEKPQLFASAFFLRYNGDQYFVFNDIGELMIVNMTPEKWEELDRVKLLEPSSVARGRNVVWSHPAISNGQAYLRNDKEIIRVNLKNK